MAAEGVVHGEGARRVADGDVDLERSDQLASGDFAELLLDRAVAVGARGSHRGGDRVHRRCGGDHAEIPTHVGHPSPSSDQVGNRIARRRMRSGHELDLARGHLLLDERVGCGLDDIGRSGDRKQRLTIEDEHLLLQPDRSRIGGIESLPNDVGVEELTDIHHAAHGSGRRREVRPSRQEPRRWPVSRCSTSLTARAPNTTDPANAGSLSANPPAMSSSAIT